MKNVVILGTGNFAQLLLSLVPAEHAVSVISARRSNDLVFNDAIKTADIIVLAIPLEGYNQTIKRLSSNLRPETLIIDVCSVKEKSIKKLHELLPSHQNWLMSHPLFGPQSARHGTKDLQFVVCESSGELADTITRYCREKLELKVIHMDAQEHDKQMARAQGLTFFISQALGSLKVAEQELMTPSYRKLVDLANLHTYESAELLDLIQNDNPQTIELRDIFVKEVDELNKELSH